MAKDINSQSPGVSVEDRPGEARNEGDCALTSPGNEAVAEAALEIGGRLAGSPSQCLVKTAFERELEAQASLFHAMGLVDVAHTLVMIEGRIVPAEPGRRLLTALLRLHERPPDFLLDPARGDVYTNREVWLSEHSDASGWLGAGRARREAVTTAFLIEVRGSLLALAAALANAGRAIAERASEFRSALMSDYTYLQAAQPTTFGHYLLGFAFPILRDLERIRELYRRLNLSPAGCGSSNGSRLPQNRERLAELLGFEGVVTHARDAMWQADLPIEAASICTSIGVNLDRLAEDLQIYATEEFGLVELDDRHARASKIMPQKKNPFALTHVRGLANTLIGTLAATAALGRTPSGQPDNRLPVYGMIPQAIEDTTGAVMLMAEVVSFLKFDAHRAAKRIRNSFALATDLAEILVLETGLDFRQAHRLVGHVVRSRLTNGDLTGLTADDLAETAERVLDRRIEFSEKSLRHALDPEAAVEARSDTGCGAPASINAMIAGCSNALTEIDGWISDRRRHLNNCEEALLEEAAKQL